MSETSVHVHRLQGCRPTPLAHYLKALGILRLVSEQTDPSARGWWQDDVFHLATTLDEDQLLSFFLNEWQPTPLLAPWNGGSGFFPKDNKVGIDALTQSTATRFEPYRVSIAALRNVLQQRDITEKPSKGTDKNGVIAAARKALTGSGRDWIDAALTMDETGEPAFPAMLGTGGNDGRLDFTQNFMQRLVSLFHMEDPLAAPCPDSVPQLSEALFSQPSPDLEVGAIGQFLPGAAGGPNGTSGFDGGISVNPWDFVLMLEGAIVFRAGVARKCQADAMAQAAAPFAVRSSGAGYASSDQADEGARGEQWLPLWPQPAGLPEVQALFLEARASTGRNRTERATDMAMAVARLGVSRGISSFERVGYIERNGLSNLAVPLGLFPVSARPNQDLVTEVAAWIDHFRRVASHKTAPATIAAALRSCESSLLSCTTHPHGNHFLELLICLARAEDQLVRSPRFAADRFARPLPRLSAQWIDVIDQDVGTTEWRLAKSLAFQDGPLAAGKPRRSVRHHWLPLADNERWFRTGESGLALTRDQTAIGLDLERSLLALMERRLLAAAGTGGKRNIPLQLTRNQDSAQFGDLQAFLRHQVNDTQLLATARGLMAVDNRSTTSRQPTTLRNNLAGMGLYAVLRLALPCRTVTLNDGHNIDVRCNPVVFRRLQAGDLTGSLRLAGQQLAAAGLRPRIQLGAGNPAMARRLAASLAFGLSPRNTSRLAREITQSEMPDDVARRYAAFQTDSP